MLTEEEIQQALHASRVVDLKGIPTNGPLEMQHLAGVISRTMTNRESQPTKKSLSILLPIPLLAKLENLAKVEGQRTSQNVTAADVVSAIVERYLESVRT